MGSDSSASIDPTKTAGVRCSHCGERKLTARERAAVMMVQIEAEGLHPVTTQPPLFIYKSRALQSIALLHPMLDDPSPAKPSEAGQVSEIADES